MKRRIILAAVTTAVLLAACGGAASPAPSGSLGPVATGQPTGSATASGDISAQFGGDVCSALTKAEIEAAKYPQGAATFSSTDTQKDAATGKAVVCQYLVSFTGGKEIVAVAVSLMTADDFGNRGEQSIIAPPVSVPGIGSEAYLVLPAPSLYEVWVHGAHGYFKLGAQAKDSAIALATIAAGRD